ncbi:MAG: FecR domain-containing protein [Kiritimatiellia bacterium]
MLHDRKFAGCLLVGLLTAAVCLGEEQLHPVLRARDVVGSVTVQRAGTRRYQPVEADVTYAYGSTFRTEADSSVRLEMSSESAVLILPATEIVFAESTQDARIKRVRLMRGEVEANLSAEFGESGYTLNIESANSVAQARGTRYRVATRFEEGFHTVVIRVLAGLVRVLGENFEVAEMGADEWLSLVGPPDNSFLRLHVMRGAFDLTVKDAEKENQNVGLQEGGVAKIWQQIVPETGERVVSVHFINPAGEEYDSVSVTFAAGEVADFLASIRDGGDDAAWGPAVEDRPARRREVADGENPIPPDVFLDELVDRLLEGLMPLAGRSPAIAVPRPPVRPTPTPVGNR